MTQRRPPSVDSIVRLVDDGSLPRPLVVETTRLVVDAARRDPGLDVEAAVRRRLADIRRSVPRRVVNATGVILHTNLGRAPWSAEALAMAAEVSGGYANVELDLVTGERGGRNATAERLLTILTGGEAAIVVNNNAAALFLVLMAFASGRRVPVSRGELIEIGGSYRLPELMGATGAELVEVGTTNRTRIADYRAVADAALLLKVHPSNYRILGFSEDAAIDELTVWGGELGVPTVYDVGSGLLDDQVPWLDGPPPPWLQGEPGVKQSLAAGADLVLFSGDKLVGGPQAGLIVGKRELVERLRRHPATRALRVDGATIAALTATLAAYLDGRGATIPVWRMATTEIAAIERRARSVVEAAHVEAAVVDGFSTLGAGSAPGAEIPTKLIEMEPAEDRHRSLLGADPAILGRRSAGSLLIDLRTVDPLDDDAIVAALRA